MEHEKARIFAGIDWATEAHEVCVIDADGEIVGQRAFAHDGPGLASMANWVAAFAHGDTAAVWAGIEVPHGAVVETLLERGFAVHSLNPRQMDRFRDRFTVAGAKDDRLDARVIADSLRTDARCFRRLSVENSVLVELREWSRMADELQRERTRLTNRMTEQLRRYYPQMLKLGAPMKAEWFLALWSLLPTPAKAQRVHRPTVTRLLRKHRIRKWTATGVLEVLRESPVTVIAGTVDAATAHIRLLVARIRLVNEQLAEAHARLDALCDTIGAAPPDGGVEDEPGQRIEQRDVELLRSLPGVGRIVLAALLAEASQALAARDYHALRSLAGVAPVTRNSGKRQGKRSVVVMRRACCNRLQTAMYHWSRVSVQHDPASRRQYAALRAKGHSHGRALRGVSDRLLNMMCAMLRDGTAYDPTKRQVRVAAAA